MFAALVLALVFLLIALRQVLRLKVRIWQIMLCGALAVLLTGQISPQNAFASIDWDVMLFLFGMFAIGQALEQSGYLSHISYGIFSRAKNVPQLVMLIIAGAAASSAILLNDTIAIVGTPVCLALATHHKIEPKLLLLALAFAITLGSVPSPIGNPQNLIIALNANMQNPFFEFAARLLVPTIINLALAYFLLKVFYKKEFEKQINCHERGKISDEKLAFLSKISVLAVLALIAAKIGFVLAGIEFAISLIAIIAMLPIVVFSHKRLEVIKRIDWPTLVFFVSMFILMQSVWDCGFFQEIMAQMHSDFTSIPAIMGAGIVISQFISNVPLVALYMPILLNAGADAAAMLALAAGSTIAGNLTILGAASNVIIVQNAEKKGHEGIGFFEFAKIGILLTITNATVYWLFLVFF